MVSNPLKYALWHVWDEQTYYNFEEAAEQLRGNYTSFITAPNPLRDLKISGTGHPLESAPILKTHGQSPKPLSLHEYERDCEYSIVNKPLTLHWVLLRYDSCLLWHSCLSHTITSTTDHWGIIAMWMNMILRFVGGVLRRPVSTVITIMRVSITVRGGRSVWWHEFWFLGITLGDVCQYIRTPYLVLDLNKICLYWVESTLSLAKPCPCLLCQGTLL